MNSKQTAASWREQMRQANIDVELSQQILQTLNDGYFDAAAAQQSTTSSSFEIPEIDGKTIVDFSSGLSYRVSAKRLRQLGQQFPELYSTLAPYLSADEHSAEVELKQEQIAELGLWLSPYFAFGVLNGGSASSYFDSKKNQGFSPAFYQLFQTEFESLAQDFSQLPKALCPAFLTAGQQAGEAERASGKPNYGPSFMGLKLRSLLHMIGKQQQLREQKGLAAGVTQSKFFQMTSELTHGPLQEYIQSGWQQDPAQLQGLVDELGWQPSEQISSEKQPLMATFDKNPENPERWQFFRDKNGDYLPMPGGHGQCFFALRHLLQQLYQQGTRYISLGNIDNIGYNPEPSFIGLLALSGSTSFFVCSYRSSVDIKGGVLLRPASAQNAAGSALNCFDIGVGVDKDILQVAQQQGKDLLFNCAIGYFQLEALLRQLDGIIAKLPLRMSEQNKDCGHYWQIEQVTWEVMGLLDSVLIGAVRKEDYFLAAKLQLEAFVNTAYQLPRYGSELEELAQLARRFSVGYAKVLRRDCDYLFTPVT